MTPTITIQQADLGDGVMLYEMLVDGEVVWSGLGNSSVHGLVRTLGSLAKREPPNLLDEEVQHLDVVVMARLRS